MGHRAKALVQGGAAGEGRRGRRCWTGRVGAIRSDDTVQAIHIGLAMRRSVFLIC